MNRVGVLLELGQVTPAAIGEGDEVAVAVGRVCLTADLVAALEPVEDAVDVVAVISAFWDAAQQAQQIGLA